MVYLRYPIAPLFLFLCLTASNRRAQSATPPDAPKTSPLVASASSSLAEVSPSGAAPYADRSSFSFSSTQDQSSSTSQTAGLNSNVPHQKPGTTLPLDADGNPIPLERQQPQRILGFMPNFRSVSAGAKPHPPSWKYNFTVATHQSLDYSTFLFLGLTSLFAEGYNEHPSLGKGPAGFYAYGWRGFLDKTDGTYLSAWLLPSLLHEDTRFYPLGHGHSIVAREFYVIDRQAITRTYGGAPTLNIAGLGGKVLTQVISRTYYPPSATNFGSLAEKFGYSVMRDVIFSNIREFYPDIAAHYIRKHREKVARQAALDAHPTTP